VVITNTSWTQETKFRDHAIEVFQTTLTADTDGAVNSTTKYKVSGFVKQCYIEPDSGTAPSADWDLELHDDPVDDSTEGPDLLNGQGANLSGTATTTLGPSDLKGGLVAKGQLKLKGTNMGSGGIAVVTVYVARFR